MFSTGDELMIKDQWGGISIIHASNMSVSNQMSNQTFVSVAATIFQRYINAPFS